MSGRYSPSRRDVIKHGAALGTLALGMHALPRFAGKAGAAQLARNETLYIAGLQWGPPTTFNPLSADPAWPADVNFALLFEQLYSFNLITGEIEPLLATDFQMDEAAGVATITLQEGTTWQDGEVLDADDVVYTLTIPEREKGVNFSAFADYVSSVDKVDDRTVTLTLNPERMHVGMVRHLINRIPILPQHIWEPREAEGLTTIVDLEPVGSGPFRIATASAEQVVLTRHDDYWGAELHGLPAPANIVHPIFDSNDAGNLALQRGEIDISQQFAPQIWQMWEDQELPVGTWYTDQPYHVPGNIPMLHINISTPGLDNPQVRRALAYSINYAQIAETAMSRYSAPVNASLIIPQGAEEQFFNADAVAATGWEYDPEKARAILEDDLGATKDGNVYVLADGTRLGPWKVQCPYGWTDWMTALELVAQGAQEAGFDITTEFPEAPVVTTAVQNGTFDLALWSVQGVSAAGPWMRFRDVLDNRGVPDRGQNAFWNYTRYKNEEAEALLDQAASAAADELADVYTKLDDIYRADIPTIPLMYRPLEFYEFNESAWTNFPTDANPYAPPMHSGSGVHIFSNLKPAGE